MLVTCPQANIKLLSINSINSAFDLCLYNADNWSCIFFGRFYRNDESLGISSVNIYGELQNTKLHFSGRNPDMACKEVCLSLKCMGAIPNNVIIY